jgi:hypothetical protein
MLDPRNSIILSDEGIWTRIQSAWWLAKEDIAMHKFGSHLDAQMIDKGFEAPINYRDDRVAWEIVEILGEHFRQLLKYRVQKSPFYGIMADETTDNSTTTQLIIYVKFLDERNGVLVPTIEYLDLVSPASGSATDIAVASRFMNELIE